MNGPIYGSINLEEDCSAIQWTDAGLGCPTNSNKTPVCDDGPDVASNGRAMDEPRNAVLEARPEKDTHRNRRCPRVAQGSVYGPWKAVQLPAANKADKRYCGSRCKLSWKGESPMKPKAYTAARLGGRVTLRDNVTEPQNCKEMGLEEIVGLIKGHQLMAQTRKARQFLAAFHSIVMGRAVYVSRTDLESFIRHPN